MKKKKISLHGLPQILHYLKFHVMLPFESLKVLFNQPGMPRSNPASLVLYFRSNAPLAAVKSPAHWKEEYNLFGSIRKLTYPYKTMVKYE